MGGPDAPTEADSKRNGLLSYAAEWHAFTIGMYDGLRARKLRVNGELPDNKDVQKEPHYYSGGFVIGTILQFIVIVTMAFLGGSSLGLF